jgi:methylated-DNA-[protein]-cysteine S-methyltransferase
MLDAVDLGRGQGVIALPRLGALWLAWDHAGLVALHQHAALTPAALRDTHLRAGRDDREVPSLLRAPFEAFDRGEPIDLAEVPVLLEGPPFFVAVWSALRRVARGTVRTYGGLARDAGSPRATRAVGTAMARNPLPMVVPCHRAIASGSHLGGFSDAEGTERKKVLLALEGVRVDGDRVLPGQLDLL